MIKKLGIVLLVLATFGAILFLASPANAAQDNLNCTGPGSADVSGRLAVIPLAGEFGERRLDVFGTVSENNGSHGWDWTLFHNGSVSARGPASKDFTVERTMINGFGIDVIRFRAISGNGNIVCNATVNY